MASFQPGELRTTPTGKFYIGVVLIITSFVFGFTSKIEFMDILWTGKVNWVALIIYAGSWALLFVGIIFLGRDTMRIIDAYIKKRVKEVVDKTSKVPRKHLRKQMTNIKSAAGRMKNAANSAVKKMSKR